MKYLFALISVMTLMLAANTASADTTELDRQILGVWQLKMTTPDGMAREPYVVVGRQYDSYEAWYVGENGLEAMKAVRLDGETLTGSLVPKSMPDVTVTLEARLQGENQCQGTGKYRDTYGDTGSWSFTGKHLTADAFSDITKWELEFTTPDYEHHTATVLAVVVDGEYHAWYSDKHREIPAQKLTVNGDQVTMKVVAKTDDGTVVKVEFKGRVDGEEIEGEAKYEMGYDSGTFAFSAKQAG
jgi:hypothetical protein